jgi:sulfonate transport system substrate-binding protein
MSSRSSRKITPINWLVIFILISLATLIAFAPKKASSVTNYAAELATPLSQTVPPGVVLRVGDPMTKWVFAQNGWDKELPFRIDWAEITGGPDVTEAFHADALDVGLGASIPPIHAIWMGIPVRIIAFREYADRSDRRAYVLGIAPNAKINSLEDLRGKRIAFSPSQVQGLIVLQTLNALGIKKDEVTLVELPSSIGGDVYTNALVSGAIDAAPIRGDIVAQRYLRDYAASGAKILQHPGFRDDGLNVYVPEKVLADPKKAAALRIFAEYWGRAQRWINDNPEQLAQGYFVENRGLPLPDARFMAEYSRNLTVPTTWESAIAYQQAAIDTLAPETNHAPLQAENLFDRRFEAVAGTGFSQVQGATP